MKFGQVKEDVFSCFSGDGRVTEIASRILKRVLVIGFPQESH